MEVGPANLMDKVRVLEGQLNLSAEAPLVEKVADALEALGLSDELKGQTLQQKVDAALLGVSPTAVPMAAPVPMVMQQAQDSDSLEAPAAPGIHVAGGEFTLVTVNDKKNSFGMSISGTKGQFKICTMSYDGLAAGAGVQINDTLMAVNSQPVEGQDKLFAQLRKIPHGENVTFTLIRNSDSYAPVALPKSDDQHDLASVGKGLFCTVCFIALPCYILLKTHCFTRKGFA